MKTLLAILALSLLLAFPVFAEEEVDWQLKAKQHELTAVQFRLAAMQKEFELCQLKIASIQREAPLLQKQIKALQEEIKKLKEKANEKVTDKPGDSKPVDPAKPE